MYQDHRCTGCGEVKLRSEFFKRRDRPSGIQSRCKQCQTVLVRTWEKNNRGRVIERQRLSRAADPERFHEYNVNWVRNNPERKRELEVKSYAKHRSTEEGRQRDRERTRIWKRNNPERQKALEKRWRDNNPGKLAETSRKACKKYRERHPEAIRELETHRKRAKQSSPSWGDKEKMRIVYKKAREWNMEVDHIIPLRHDLVCGLHVWHNLQLLDRNLNRTKHNILR